MPLVHAWERGGGPPAVNVAEGPTADDLKTLEAVRSDRSGRLWVSKLLHYAPTSLSREETDTIAHFSPDIATGMPHRMDPRQYARAV